MSKRNWHHFYRGELSDAPGRNESWDDYLCYLGRGRWGLWTESTDFFGEEIEPVKDAMCTRDLISWVRTQDDADEDQSMLQQ